MDIQAEIRPYMHPDKDGVVALWRDVFPGESGVNDPQAIIERKLAVQPDLFFVVDLNNEIIGSIIAGFDGVRGWIHKLAVHAKYRRLGLASDLMRRAELGLREKGCPKINLQVRASNLEIVQFYESLGYSIEERASLGKPLEPVAPQVSLTGYLDVPAARLADILDALSEHVRLTRAEAGCINFQVDPDPDIPGRLHVSERFVSEAAFEHHQQRTAGSAWAKLTAGIERHYQITKEKGGS